MDKYSLIKIIIEKPSGHIIQMKVDESKASEFK
jgi:hypothetical protein